MAAATLKYTGSFALAVLVAMPATALIGAFMETLVLAASTSGHLDQVLVTFGLVLVMNDLTRLAFGVIPPNAAPAALAGSVEVMPGLPYPVFRLAILGAGLTVAAALYFIVVHTRVGMWIRAGASDRPIASALGVDVQRVFALVFAAGASLAGLAGLMAGPISAVQAGMGEPVLILALVVTVIGGIGSIRGAFFGALIIGIVDTFGRVLLSPALGSVTIFLAMAAILTVRPKGLFPGHG